MKSGMTLANPRLLSNGVELSHRPKAVSALSEPNVNADDFLTFVSNLMMEQICLPQHHVEATAEEVG